MTNRIPRNFDNLYFKMKVTTLAANIGDIIEVWKEDNNYFGKNLNGDGKVYAYMPSHLRNANFCELIERR